MSVYGLEASNDAPEGEELLADASQFLSDYYAFMKLYLATR